MATILAHCKRHNCKHCPFFSFVIFAYSSWTWEPTVHMTFDIFFINQYTSTSSVNY